MFKADHGCILRRLSEYSSYILRNVFRMVSKLFLEGAGNVNSSPLSVSML